jgi:hypothetical protein
MGFFAMRPDAPTLGKVKSTSVHGADAFSPATNHRITDTENPHVVVGVHVLIMGNHRSHWDALRGFPMAMVPIKGSTMETTTTKVHVYKESPVWETVDRWFMLPSHVLRRLYIKTYLCTVEIGLEREHTEDIAKELHAKHPGCVLVY